MSGAINSISSGLFPRKGADAYNGVTDYSTPFSSVSGGKVTLDPSIRSLQDQYLQLLQGLGANSNTITSDFMSNLSGLTGNLNDIGSRYLGDEGALIKSAVDPVQAAGNQALAATQIDLSRRGLGGSSFGYDTLAGMGIDVGNAVSNAKANAVAKNLGAESNLVNQKLGIDTAGIGEQQQNLAFQGGIAGGLDTVSQQRLQQELSSLGLSNAQIAQLMSAFSDQQSRQLGLEKNQLAGFRQFGDTVGSIFNKFKPGGGTGGSA